MESVHPVQSVEISRFQKLLEGEIAVVTGAAQGNGEAFARALAACGATVVAVDRDSAILSKTVNSINSAGGKAINIPMDVSDITACTALADKISTEVGNTSILINNAGIVRRVLTDDDGFIASIEEQLGVNSMGSVHMVKALLKQLKATKGKIINLGSIASFRPTTGGVGYGMSKGSILLMTQALAAELAPFGIRVNALAPGVIATPMTAPTRENPEVAQKYFEHIPMRRFGDTEELVGPLLFLVSPMSSYVTGVMLPVDGGFLTQ
jgi:NAD(P)-dependent dehydrogenase (short-subunit alcohol dehydrogenase family)